MRIKTILLFSIVVIISQSCAVDKEYLEPERLYPEVFSMGFRFNYIGNTTYNLGNDEYFSIGNYYMNGSTANVHIFKHDDKGEVSVKNTNIDLEQYQLKDVAIDKNNCIYFAEKEDNSYLSMAYITKYSANTELNRSRNIYSENEYYQSAAAIDVSENGEVFAIVKGTVNWEDTLLHLFHLNADFEEINRVQIQADVNNIQILELITTSDGGCIIVAKTSVSGQDLNLRFIRLDADGNEVKETAVFNSGFQNIARVLLDQDENILVLGNAFLPSSGAGYAEQFVFTKFNKNFEELWRYNYEGNYKASAKGITIDEANNSYIVVNTNLSDGSPYGRVEVPTIFKFNTDGELVLQLEYQRRTTDIFGYNIHLKDETELVVFCRSYDDYISMYHISTLGKLLE